MERLDSYDFGTNRSQGQHRGPDPGYPWDTLLDGDIYRLEQGEDFTISVGSFQRLARHACDRRGVLLRSKREYWPDTKTQCLVIQAQRRR